MADKHGVMLPPSATLPPAAPTWLVFLTLAALVLAALMAALWWGERQQRQRLARRLGRQGPASVLPAGGRGEPAEPGDPTEPVDPLQLPGLMTRARFDGVLDKAVQAVDRQRGALVVLLIHLERQRGGGLKPPGPVGDSAMQAAVQRLAVCLGGRPLAMRLGPDELLLLHPGDLASACALAGRLAEALSGGAPAAPAEADAGRRRSSLGCSIGLAAYPLHGTRSRLAVHAGIAAGAVRRAGGGGYMVFAPHMAEDQRDQADLLADLRQALAAGQLELYYQPKVSARGLRIVGVEALLRWHHPTRGIVSPAVFVPMAERAGLIGAIGDWVIQDACRQAGAWRAQGLKLPVAVNLSAFQMRQDDLADRIEAALLAHRLAPGDLGVEITESVAFEDTQVIRRAFERLRDVGVQVSVDDYGAGQANLGALRDLLATELKVDASLVRDVTSRPDVRGIVDAMVRLAHALQLKVVAMGVETEDQRDRLVQLGCDELQGYLFAKPMPAAGVAQWAAADARESARPPRVPTIAA